MNKHLSYILPILFVTILYFGSQYIFENYLYLIDITLPVTAIVLIGLHINIVRFITELNAKLLIRKQFGTYLSPKMVKRLESNPELLKLGGESKELSILFGDIRGFTSISEHFGKDVQGLTKIMNRLMTVISQPVLDNEGMVDKYIGDCIMALWNVPLDDKDHAKNAVKTALQMLGSLDEFNREIAPEGVPAFGMGLGINTDTVVVGNMGSSQRFDYTCLGDGVNLASRLEGQSKPYHVAMVIGPKTNEYVKDQYFTLPLDCLAVKGKKEGVDIYTVLGEFGKIPVGYKNAKVQHLAMYSAYQKQRFVQAKSMCRDLIGSFDGKMDAYYEMWIERCEEYNKNPPGEGWDMVYRTNSK